MLKNVLELPKKCWKKVEESWKNEKSWKSFLKILCFPKIMTWKKLKSDHQEQKQ